MILKLTIFHGFKRLLKGSMVLNSFGVSLLLISCKPQVPDPNAVEPAIDSIPHDQKNINIALTHFRKEGDAYIIPWNYMLNVRFEQKYSDSLSMEVSLPVFNDTLKAIDGQKAIIEGFYIPVDETGDEKIVILSAYPFAQCFFCGKAGVESIVDIITSQKLPKLKIDSKIRFKGRFRLNRDNFDYLIYMLEDAELVD